MGEVPEKHFGIHYDSNDQSKPQQNYSHMHMANMPRTPLILGILLVHAHTAGGILICSICPL